jgi:hypothetical protein
MNTYHIYRDTPEGRLPFTYIVFGPYANGTEWDVEVHRGHVIDNSDLDTYMFTESDLSRDTHIVGDMWDAMEDYLQGYYMNA